jgi:endonuclease/exonuclease/phosphatase family metal-dependent hydrolase
VLACQEIDDVPGLLELSRALGMPMVLGHANEPESPPAPEHLALLSRWPIVRSEVHPCDTAVMFRPVLEMWVVPPGDRPVGFFTVHFRARAGAAGSQAKQREARQLRALLEGAGGRYCALGDFNAWAPGEGDTAALQERDLPDDYRAAVAGGVIEEIQAAGMVDTWRQANPGAAAPRTLLGGSPRRVDFIFASPELAPLAASSTICMPPEAAQASDHYPVLTVFRAGA